MASAGSIRKAAYSGTWVLVAGGFHPGGGMDRCNRGLARHLVELGNKVHLVCHQADKEFLEEVAVTVHQVPKLAGSFMLGGLLLAREGRAVSRQVSAQSPEARVVVNGGNCDWPDINWVHYVHHAWRVEDHTVKRWLRTKERIFNGLARKSEQRALSGARLVIANSERTRADLVAQLKIDPERIHTVYPGIDPDFTLPTPACRAAARAWLGKDGKKPLVIFIGALGYDSRKGLDVLFSAWRKLCGRPDWDADLVVAGYGRTVEFWRREAAHAGIGDRISVLGFTDRVPDLLAAADLLVSPVRYESYGLNAAEAICCGVPAMVTESAGVAERYPTELRELLISDPGDAEDLAARLLRWQRTMTYWKERTAPFSGVLRQHTLDVMAAEIVAIAESDSSGSRKQYISA